MWSGAWILLLLALHLGSGAGQMVQTDSSALGLVGSQAELRCVLQNSQPPVYITQVVWNKLLKNGTREAVAVANADHGANIRPPFEGRVSFKQVAAGANGLRLDDATIVISDLRPSDAAEYICAYTTFPAGVLEQRTRLGTMNLTKHTVVAAPPQEANPVTVATCCVTYLADGKLPVMIEVGGPTEARQNRNADACGTCDFHVNYAVVGPSRQWHGQKVTCAVRYGNTRLADSVALDVQYRPEMKIEGFDGNWYPGRRDVGLACQADANPLVSAYHWTRLNGSLPANAEIIQNHILFFSGPVTSSMSGRYICQATNAVGTGSASIEVYVRGAGNAAITLWLAVGGALVAAAAAAAILIVCLRRQKHRQATGNESYWISRSQEPTWTI